MKEYQTILKNINDPRWRLNNLYYIVNKESELIKFKENSIQSKILDNKSPRDAILKARQFGITTLYCLMLLDYVLFNKNVTVCILAHEDDAISKIFQKPRLAYEMLHPALKPEIARGGGSKYEMYFPQNNSRIYCDLEIRGGTLSWLHISEAAFVKHERLIASLQAVPLTGNISLETTPNGLENHFYELWADEKSPYQKLFYPWFMHDEYKIKDSVLFRSKEENDFSKNAKKDFGITITDDQIGFRRFKQSELKSLYIQEYPEDDNSCFIHSGRNVVDQNLFTNLIRSAKPPFQSINDILIYHQRDVKKNYVIGADTSQGIGGDFCVASVICLEDREEVAFFRGQLSPFLFAKKLDEIASIFSNGYRVPLLGVEQNNHGHAVLLELYENIHYPNLYRQEGKETFGWITNSLTRPIMIDQYIELVSSKDLVINSIETLKETRMLIEDKGKIQAPSGKHDDCVIASAIACQMLLYLTKNTGFYSNISKDIMV